MLVVVLERPGTVGSLMVIEKARRVPKLALLGMAAAVLVPLLWVLVAAVRPDGQTSMPEVDPNAVVDPAVAASTTTVPPMTVTVEGEPVRGAVVTVAVRGFGAHVGREVAVLVRPGESEAYSVQGHGERVAPDGTAKIELFVPPVLNYDGPCPSSAPCDHPLVTLGTYRLDVVGGSMTDVLAKGELTVVAGRPGASYRTLLNSECGPPRVDFDGTVWILSTPRPGQQWDRSGLTHGTITVLAAERATFSSEGTGAVALKPADAATLATVGC
jgi:hypothetical protein